MAKEVIVKIGYIIGYTTEADIKSTMFEFCTSDYMFELTNVDGKFIVSNAVDGWGNNIKGDFVNTQVKIFREI